MRHSKRTALISILFFTLTFGASTLNASPSTEELCEKLYADYLKRAQRALSEDKREDALRFLLEAQAVAQKCADSSERPLPQNQIRESDHAFAGQHNELS